MSDDYKIQYNVKTPRDSLINLRAETPEEFEKVAAWALTNAARFIDLETAVKGVPTALAGNVTSVNVQSTQPQGAPPNYQPPQFSNEPTGPAPSCMHGPMNFKSAYSKKKEKNYSGYFCSADQCKPEQFQWAK